MTSLRLYGHDLPQEKAFVNFIFTSRDKDILNCYLLDYNLSVVMPHRFATLKRRIKSWNKITPLNKPLIGKVEEIGNDEYSTIVISIAYIDKEDEKYKEFVKEQINKNALLRFFTRYSFVNKLDLVKLWTNVIHPLDIARVETSDLSLYEYINQNLELINYDQVLYQYIKDSLNEHYNETNNKIISELGIVSIGGVENTRKLLNDTIKEINLEFEILVDSVPNYKLISNSPTINKEHHNDFINSLKEKSQYIKPPIYVKVS